jgi:signal transduction histidine kinase
VTFRSRVLLAFTGLAVLPLAVFGLGVRHLMVAELRSELERGAEALVGVAEEDLRRTDADLATRVSAIAEDFRRDDRVLRALGSAEAEDRAYVGAYAERAASRADLVWLWLVTGENEVVSSAPDPEGGRPTPAPPAALAEAATPVLITLPSEAGRLPGLARTATVQIGSTALTVMGAVAIDPSFLSGLARSSYVGVVIQYPRGVISSEDAGAAVPREAVIERSMPLAHVSRAGEIKPARLVIAYSLEPLDNLRRSVDRWLLVALALTALAAVAVALLLSSRLTRPIEELAAKTARLDLDALESEFWTGRLDEVGTLSRMLDEMIGRLRASAGRIRDSERRAAVGDLARQVNHDIRNGLVPIRNVLEHLAGVLADDPAALPGVFDERRGTLESSVEYLEEIAGTYSRLQTQAGTGEASCDVGRIVRELGRDTAVPAGVDLAIQVDAGLPAVAADPIAVRRVLDNLVRNALESLADGSGSVTVHAERGETSGVRIRVRDTGEGMTAGQLERAFDDDWSTRQRGTGLGLAIVRRLMADMGGSVTATSEPGQGTEFVVDVSAPAIEGDRV